MLKGAHRTNFAFICFLILFKTCVTQDIAEVITKGITFLSGEFNKGESTGDIGLYGSVAIAVINKLPDIIGALTSQGLTRVEDSLKRIETLQEQTRNDIKRLSVQLETTIIQNIIAQNEREIESCMESYENLLEDPTNSVLINEMKDCRQKLSNVRSVKNILSGSNTGGVGSVFDQIRKEYGYCDGRAVSQLYEYLFRLLFQGYTVMVAATGLDNNDGSQTYVNEYNTALSKTVSYMKGQFDTCADSATYCGGVGDYINDNKDMLEKPDQLISTLEEIAPYYKAFIFNLQVDTQYDIAMIEATYGLYIFKLPTRTTLIYVMKSVNTKNYNIQPIEDPNNVQQVESDSPDKTECKMRITFNCKDLQSKHGNGISLYADCSDGRQTWLMPADCLRSDIKNSGHICEKTYGDAAGLTFEPTCMAFALLFYLNVR